MSLLDLPTEIICIIAEFIPTQAGVKAFMLSHRHVSSLPQLRECLYNRTSKRLRSDKLLWACEKNDKDLARAMLRLGANIRWRSRDRVYTPLTLAATGGHAEIVKLLLKHDPSIINEAADSGDVALKEAIWRGHVKIVKILLTQPELDPLGYNRDRYEYMAPHYYREVPLNEALARGNEEIVRILMEDGRFKLDHYSLAAAADGGNESLVRMCLQKAPLGDRHWDECPLYRAASRGHEGAMRLLLEDDRQDPSAKDRYGATPLHAAANGGHGNIVKLLIDRDDVELDVADMSQMTPFSAAASYGHVGVMELLLDSGKVDPNTRDSMRRTPLSHAAEQGEPAAVRLLVATGKVELDSKCYLGRTPLSWAAYNGVPDTARVLLGTGCVDINVKDEDGRTPLSLAAGSSHYLNNFRDCKPRDSAQELREICNILNKRTDLATSSDKSSRQRGPCGWPAKCDPLDIIEQLLACDEINADSPDHKGQTPLMWAAQNNQVDAVRLLMATGKVNPERCDNDGWTAKIHAEKRSKPTKPVYDAAGWDAWENSFDG
jgi:ankyrin repeat protein